MFIDAEKLDLKRYATRPALAKALCDFILYHDHNPRKALELAAEATKACNYKDWWWKARLGRCYYQLGLLRDAEKQYLSAIKEQVVGARERAARDERCLLAPRNPPCRGLRQMFARSCPTPWRALTCMHPCIRSFLSLRGAAHCGDVRCGAVMCGAGHGADHAGAVQGVHEAGPAAEGARGLRKGGRRRRGGRRVPQPRAGSHPRPAERRPVRGILQEGPADGREQRGGYCEPGQQPFLHGPGETVRAPASRRRVPRRVPRVL
jgi:hypothetical protein